jgi:hypothetical protein
MAAPTAAAAALAARRAMRGAGNAFRSAGNAYQGAPQWVKLVIAGGIVGGGVYLAVKFTQPSRWLKRMGEPDVQVAGYFVGLVGPDGFWAKIKKAINPVEWAKSFGNDISNFFFGKTVEAIKRGIDRATDWQLVEEAYHGLTNSALWNDIRKKVNEKEYLELQDYHKARFERQREHQVTMASDRTKIIAIFYNGSRSWKTDRIYKLGPTGDQFKSYRVAAYKDTDGKPERGSAKRFKARQFIGSPTNRLRKDKKGRLHMEIASGFGLLWFALDDLDIYKG